MWVRIKTYLRNVSRLLLQVLTHSVLPVVKICDATEDFFMKLTGIFYFGVYVEYRITGANIFRPQKGLPFNKYGAGKPQYRQMT